MGFSILGGLNAMGGAIAQTAGTAALEIQRSELEKEKVALANALAEDRDSRTMDKQAALNEAAADKDRSFRSGESLLNRQSEAALEDVRQKGATERATIQESAADKRAREAESNTQHRFDEDMALRIEQVKAEARTRKETLAVNNAVAAATKNTMEKYTTAGGFEATRPVKTFDPDLAAKILRSNGFDDIADMLSPKGLGKNSPSDKNRPPLDSFFKE